MTIAAAGHRQTQLPRPAAQLQSARTAKIGIFDLDRTQSASMQLGQVLLLCNHKAGAPGRNAARVAHQSQHSATGKRFFGTLPRSPR